MKTAIVLRAFRGSQTTNQLQVDTIVLWMQWNWSLLATPPSKPKQLPEASKANWASTLSMSSQSRLSWSGLDKTVICNFLQVNPDTIWQPCSMIILPQVNFQVLLVGPRTRQAWKAHPGLFPSEWRTGDGDGCTRPWLPRRRGVSWIRKMVIHSDATAADQAAVQGNRPDVKELLSLLCKDFLQDSGSLSHK